MVIGCHAGWLIEQAGLRGCPGRAAVYAQQALVLVESSGPTLRDQRPGPSRRQGAVTSLLCKADSRCSHWQPCRGDAFERRVQRGYERQQALLLLADSAFHLWGLGMPAISRRPSQQIKGTKGLG